MASIYTCTDSHGIIKYYGSINHNNLRIRRYLGLTKKSAKLILQKLEYKTSFSRRNCTTHIQSNFTSDFVLKNNINLLTLHHTYAHNMLNKEVPKEVLQTLLGHRSIKTTEIYANWVRKEVLERWV